jgi:hypothetical protein
MSKINVYDAFIDDPLSAFYEFNKLKAERDALAAQVEALKDTANSAYCNWRSSSDVFGGMQRLIAAVEATPTQCLSEIKAEAILGFATYIDSTGELSGDDCTFIIDEANQYAEQIRQGGAK